MICIVLCYFFCLNTGRIRGEKWILGMVLVLVGCAGPEIRRAEIITVVIQPVHEQVDLTGKPFVLTGRLVVNAKQQKFSGGIRWRHTRKRDEIYLFSPLGQVVAEILRDQTGVRLSTSEPAIYQAQSAEYLTSQVLGWELPLAGLQFWVRGEHFPGTVAEKDLDKHDHTIAIRQDGWNIVYRSYYPDQSTTALLPKLLEFSRLGIKMKLIVDQWGGEVEHATGVDRVLLP